MGSDLEKFLESSKRYLNERERLGMSSRAFIDYLKLQITSHALTVGTIDKLRRARICIDKSTKYLMKEHVVVATCARHYGVSFTVYCKTSFLDKSPIFCGQISHHFEDKYPTEMRTNLHWKWPFFRNYTYSIANPRLPTHLPQNLSIPNHYYCLFRRLRHQGDIGKNCASHTLLIPARNTD